MAMESYESYESYESADTLPRQRISYHRYSSDVRMPSNIYARSSRRHQIKTHEPSNDVYSQVQKPTKKDKLESKYNKTPKILTPIFVVFANSK